MIYEYWLAGIEGIPGSKKRKLREVYGDGKTIYYIEETKLKKHAFLNEKDLERLEKAKKDTEIEIKWEKLREKKIKFVPYFSDDYPEKLKVIADPPYALYVLGTLPDKEAKCAAIVGARNCTSYGEQMALQYGKYLAAAGIQVISGMARGIDGAGQRGALNGSGKTFAVLGCGVDVCYPRENIGLYMDIQKNGGIISEFPSGTEPFARNFPMRNRIISGLSEWILVIEAKERSGSLITADLALDQGKDVYALPGPVTSALSQGCHRLIRQGAGILITPEELLDEWNLNQIQIRQKIDKNEKMLESPERMVYSCLGLFPKGIDELMKETGLSVSELMERLITLELKGYAKEVSRNYYIRLL